MAQQTKIEWADATWNPVVGCTKVSPGCAHCYAEGIAERDRGTAGFPNGFDLTLKPKKLSLPTNWKAPRVIFVNSMSDIFHEDIPDEYLEAIWATMLGVNRHIYLVLTKRHEQMVERIHRLKLRLAANIWLGVSAENQRWFDERVPKLLGLRPATAFVSIEPMLGPIDISSAAVYGLDWVIVGAESGIARRPFDPDWARAVRDQCQRFDLPFFFKQGSAYHSGRERILDGQTWNDRPEVKR